MGGAYLVKVESVRGESQWPSRVSAMTEREVEGSEGGGHQTLC